MGLSAESRDSPYRDEAEKSCPAAEKKGFFGLRPQNDGLRKDPSLALRMTGRRRMTRVKVERTTGFEPVTSSLGS